MLRDTRPLVLSIGAAAALMTCMQARAIDALLAERNISSTAGGVLITSNSSCMFRALGQPLTLIDAVERGLCNNPKTREAWASVKAQAAAVGVARAAFLPTLSLTWQGVRDNSVTEITGQPQLSSSTVSNIRSESATLNWLLFDFGGRASALRNASELLAAARATQEATLQTEFANVAKDYYAVQAAQGALAAAGEIERMTQDSLTAAQTRVDRGVAPVTDVFQAQTQHDEAVFDLTKAKGDAQTAIGTLASEIGLDPSESLLLPAVTATATPDEAFSDSVVELIRAVKRTHPSVLAAQQQYEAATEKIGQTRAEGLPSVSFVAKYSRNNQPASLGLGIPSYPATGHDAYIGVQVTIPFFEGFGRHYQIRQAEAEAERQRDIVDETQQRVALDVWTSYQALHTATQNAMHSEAILEIARRSFDAAQARYRAGVGNILELLSTQTSLAKAQQRRVQAIADWQNAKIEFAAKLGRLDSSAITENLPANARSD